MYSNCKFINLVCTKSVSVAIGKKDSVPLLMLVVEE